jgi:hypothetical protein
MDIAPGTIMVNKGNGRRIRIISHKLWGYTYTYLNENKVYFIYIHEFHNLYEKLVDMDKELDTL